MNIPLKVICRCFCHLSLKTAAQYSCKDVMHFVIVVLAQWMKLSLIRSNQLFMMTIIKLIYLPSWFKCFVCICSFRNNNLWNTAKIRKYSSFATYSINHWSLNRNLVLGIWETHLHFLKTFLINSILIGKKKKEKNQLFKALKII